VRVLGQCAARTRTDVCPWQVLYLNDGQNLYTDSDSFSGRSWMAAHSAAAAIASGAAPPFLLCGVDHAGPLRSLDYTPVVPGTGVDSFRADAATWPGGGVGPYLDALHTVVFPLIQARFGASSQRSRCAFGGSSFGAICALHAVTSGHPVAASVGALLAESPSLWIEEGRYNDGVLIPAAKTADWPARTFLAMGSREHTGTRPVTPAGLAADKLHVRGALKLVTALRGVGMDAARLCFVLEPDGAHNERDWARRLPQAIAFLMGPMAAGLGAPVKRALSSPAAARSVVDEPAASPAAAPAAEPAVVEVPAPAPASQLELALARASTAATAPADMNLAMKTDALFYFVPREPVAGASVRLMVNKRRCGGGVADGRGLTLVHGYNDWAAAFQTRKAALHHVFHVGDHADWYSCVVELPADAEELNFALSSECGVHWESNEGSNFSVPLVSPKEAVPNAANPRRVASEECHPLAGGHVHVLTLAPRQGAATAAEDRANRWQIEKTLRVWTPPGWSLDAAPPGGYPVIYISDAQNLFEDWRSHSGVSWRAAEAAAHLIGSGQLPPLIIVGIDAAGAFRCLNYLPFAPVRPARDSQRRFALTFSRHARSPLRAPASGTSAPTAPAGRAAAWTPTCAES
jgi:predicted alpha/beta superfamily hydrolase